MVAPLVAIGILKLGTAILESTMDKPKKRKSKKRKVKKK